MDNYNFIPPFFLFLAWRPSWLEVGITGHNFERGPSKDHSTKVWLQLAQWFLRRRLKCEMLTDGRRTKSDDNSSPGLKGELKMAQRERGHNQALCYGKCWSKLLLTKQTFDLFFSQSCDIKSEFSYIICSYLKRLVIQNSLKYTETVQIFIDPLPNAISIFN
jgi:hypothetical protein